MNRAAREMTPPQCVHLGHCQVHIVSFVRAPGRALVARVRQRRAEAEQPDGLDRQPHAVENAIALCAL